MTAVQTLCSNEDNHEIYVLEGLGSLCSKSLLQPEQVEDDAEPRFLILKTIGEYTTEHIETSGEGDVLRQQHADYFLALAEKAQPELFSAEQLSWLDSLERDHDNLRSALEWYVERGQSSGNQLFDALGSCGLGGSSRGAQEVRCCGYHTRRSPPGRTDPDLEWTQQDERVRELPHLTWVAYLAHTHVYEPASTGIDRRHPAR